MNLYDVMMGAGGGQGVTTLANQFGISQQQTQAALQAMMPAFSLGMQNTALDPLGFGALLNQMTNAAHVATYANPAQATAAAALGGNVLAQIFGSQAIAQQIGQQAALASGVSPQVIQQMMPLVASMLIGGIAQAMAAQGLGNMIGQLANTFAAGAGLNANPGGPMNPAANIAANAGNLMNAWMNMLGSLASGGAAPAPATPQAAAFKVGLNTLNGLMQAGVQISNAQQQGFSDILQSISNASKAARA